MRESQIDYAALASALAHRLALVTPAAIEIGVVGSTIHLRKAGTPWGMDADLSQPSGSPLCSLLESVLDQFQDEIAETLTEPWPATAPHPMPEPFAEIHGDALIVGYGDPADPVLRLRPVPLNDVV